MRILLVCLICVAAGVIVLALTTRDDDDDVGTTSPAVPTAGCESLVASRIPPPASEDLVVGPVYLQGARARARDRRTEYVRRHGNDPTAKVPVIVQPGTTAILSVAPRDRSRASLSYREATRGAARVPEGDPAVRFHACFRDTPTGWPGGFLLRGPSCVEVTLAVSGRDPVSRTLRFGREAC